MNDEIETIFRNFIVSGVSIPVKFLYYQGHGEPYVIYMETQDDGSVFADDDLVGYVTYFDFDVYAKGNYVAILDAIKAKMKDNGWTWQVSRSSEDMYEPDTGYYHKTLCFAKHREELDTVPAI